ncbi:MAG TPA: aromatic acid exporter family protein [Nocardioides sp.]|nr:aromatic acid exporter family protein [Nocardioides sp.]
MREDAPARRLRAASQAHPGWFLAAKAGLAAMVAWLVVQPLGITDAYPYYAPLGALVAVSTSVVGSVRTSLQAVVALLLGAGLALIVEVLPVPEPLALGLAIVVASMVAGWRALGGMASWVPFAALFVLIAGASDPIEYAGAYIGLTSAGALVGVVVNLLLPQLPLTPAALAQDRLRAALADQLDQLATALDEHVLGEHDWAALRRTLAHAARDAEDLTDQARDAARANWNAPRWSAWVEHRDARLRALQRLAGSVDEVVALVSEQRTEIDRDDDVAAALRSAAARAFRSVAALLRNSTEVAADRARTAVADLRALVFRAQAESDAPHFAAAAITLNLEQAVDAWS